LGSDTFGIFILGDTKMKFGRLFSGGGIICCLLVLQGWFAAQTLGEQSPAPSGVEGQAQAKPSAQAEPNQGVPVISFEQTTYDFGSVAPGSINNCEFKFQNKGTGLLKIGDISKTCGCTVFSLEKKDYPPGEQGVLKVQYHADNGTGQRMRSLFVSSNDPNKPRTELIIAASIAQRVVFQPERLEYKLRGDKADVAELTIRSVDGQPFAITKLASSYDAVTANFDTNQKEAKFVLQTRIDPQKMGAGNAGRLDISITRPESPLITVPFSILPRFKVDPPAINVLDGEPKKPVQRELWLLNNYGDDFDVNSVTSKDGIIKLVSQERLGNRYKFTIEITPPEPTGTARVFTDTLSIGIKDGEKINVACRGFYKRS
jgi:hypothetical protein